MPMVSLIPSVDCRESTVSNPKTLARGEMLQVFFLTRREEGRNGWTASLRLVKSCILLILILFPAIFFAQTEVSPGRFPILRTQSDVFKLTKAEAAQGRPIAIEAVVAPEPVVPVAEPAAAQEAASDGAEEFSI